MSASIGCVIDDKYEIVGEVARGGMSIVWLGRDLRLGKMWAVKEVRPNEGGEAGRVLRQAIIDEANFMKRLDHPCIPRVVDIIDTGAELYVVMDYVNGQSLSCALVSRGRPFTQEQVVAWGIQLCDVLSYLHDFVTPEGEHRQIVYRDLKPANVMLRDDDQVRLIDFGVCWERAGGQNNDGMIVGSPGYAPPEQLPPEPRPQSLPPDVVIDARVDIYALGTTLYSLASGHVPKVVRDADGKRRVSFELRPLRSWDASLSEGLECIIERVTQPDPAQRYQTIEEMRHDLEHYERLTSAYRESQKAKVTRFRRRVAGAFACVASGVALLGMSALVQATDYEALMREASIASAESVDGRGMSSAEELYMRAIEVDPTHVEPFEALVRDVYEVDDVFTSDEESRWNEIFRRYETQIRPSDGYARLCFDAGVCHLCFYGVADDPDVDGAVGQNALINAGKARPWFERVASSCTLSRDESGAVTFDKGSQDIDDADVLAADVYLRIAEFNELRQRAAREGRAAGDVYQRFWDALRQAVDTAPAYIEGVRLRLCQIAFEAIAADDVLDGVYRKALEDGRAEESRQEALDLLDAIVAQVNADDMRRFAEAPGNRDVYGPMYRQVTDNLDLARKNISRTYENPVARTEARGVGTTEDE